MADDTTKDDTEAKATRRKPAADAPAPASRVDYIVTYPAISVIVGEGADAQEFILEKGARLSDHLPAEAVAEKGPFLVSIGMVLALSVTS